MSNSIVEAQQTFHQERSKVLNDEIEEALTKEFLEAFKTASKQPTSRERCIAMLYSDPVLYMPPPKRIDFSPKLYTHFI